MCLKSKKIENVGMVILAIPGIILSLAIDLGSRVFTRQSES